MKSDRCYVFLVVGSAWCKRRDSSYSDHEHDGRLHGRLARRVIRISPTYERVIIATRPWVLKWPTAVLAGAFAQNSRKEAAPP